MRPLAIETQIADTTPVTAPVQHFNGETAADMEQGRTDAIVADLRYAFPKNTPPGAYTVKFKALIGSGSMAFMAISVEASPIPEFDEAVKQAIYRAAPFPGHEGKIIKFSCSATVP